MIDFAPLHQAIYARLSADPEYPVFDAVPQGTEPPYVVIGEVTQVPDAELDRDGASFTLTFHGFSDHGSKRESYQMQAWLRGHLHHRPVGDAWACFEEFATVLSQGSTSEPQYHLAVRYRIRLQGD